MYNKEKAKENYINNRDILNKKPSNITTITRKPGKNIIMSIGQNINKNMQNKDEMIKDIKTDRRYTTKYIKINLK